MSRIVKMTIQPLDQLLYPPEFGNDDVSPYYICFLTLCLVVTQQKLIVLTMSTVI